MSFRSATRFVPPTDWPPQEYEHHHLVVTRRQYSEFRQMVEGNAGEKTLDAHLRRNPVIFTAAMNLVSTGHHGTWVIPQQIIQPKIKGVAKGLIPDFLVGGKSSDGFEWWVIEQKN